MSYRIDIKIEKLKLEIPKSEVNIKFNQDDLLNTPLVLKYQEDECCFKEFRFDETKTNIGKAILAGALFY